MTMGSGHEHDDGVEIVNVTNPSMEGPVHSRRRLLLFGLLCGLAGGTSAATPTRRRCSPRFPSTDSRAPSTRRARRASVPRQRPNGPPRPWRRRRWWRAESSGRKASLRDLEQCEQPVWRRPPARARSGSVSKAITSARARPAARPAEAGSGCTGSEIRPTFPQKAYPITTRQWPATCRASALRRARRGEVYDTRHYKTGARGALHLSGRPAVQARRAKYRLLQPRLERVERGLRGASGKDYLGYMQAHVSNPLGTRTIADFNERIISQPRPLLRS